MVPGVSPVNPREKDTSISPLPRDVSDVLTAGTRVPKRSLQTPGFVVAYRKYPNAAFRFGSPAPLIVADVAVTTVAGEVVAVGAVGVVNDKIAPNATPSALEAIAQK